MSTTIPERSQEQRDRALQRANEIRLARAAFKHQLKEGRRSPLPALTRPPDYVESMKVYDLLLALPRVGRSKAQTLLRRNEISPVKTIAGLSERQRQTLIKALNGGTNGGTR